MQAKCTLGDETRLLHVDLAFLCGILTLGWGGRMQAKCTLGDETRLLHVGPAVSYAEMLEGVRMKFDNPGPFSLKFTDK